jgi:hypothetical protein
VETLICGNIFTCCHFRSSPRHLGLYSFSAPSSSLGKQELLVKYDAEMSCSHTGNWCDVNEALSVKHAYIWMATIGWIRNWLCVQCKRRPVRLECSKKKGYDVETSYHRFYTTSNTISKNGTTRVWRLQLKECTVGESQSLLDRPGRP